jgi:hypothetical protein
MGQTPPEVDQGVDRDQVIRAAYTAAGRRLRDAHHDEFIQYQIEECEKRGLNWRPRETPEQRAASEFDRLLREYPFLADRLPLDTSPGAAETP